MKDSASIDHRARAEDMAARQTIDEVRNEYYHGIHKNDPAEGLEIDIFKRGAAYGRNEMLVASGCDRNIPMITPTAFVKAWHPTLNKAVDDFIKENTDFYNKHAAQMGDTNAREYMIQIMTPNLFDKALNYFWFLAKNKIAETAKIKKGLINEPGVFIPTAEVDKESITSIPLPTE